jgi:excisionase family DNA binding protein
MKELSGLVSETQAAERLGIEPSRVHRMIKAGRLPAVRVAGRIAIRESALAKCRPMPHGRPRKRNSGKRGRRK